MVVVKHNYTLQHRGLNCSITLILILLLCQKLLLLRNRYVCHECIWPQNTHTKLSFFPINDSTRALLFVYCRTDKSVACSDLCVLYRTWFFKLFYHVPKIFLSRR